MSDVARPATLEEKEQSLELTELVKAGDANALINAVAARPQLRRWILLTTDQMPHAPGTSHCQHSPVLAALFSDTRSPLVSALINLAPDKSKARDVVLEVLKNSSMYYYISFNASDHPLARLLLDGQSSDVCDARKGYRAKILIRWAFLSRDAEETDVLPFVMEVVQRAGGDWLYNDGAYDRNTPTTSAIAGAAFYRFPLVLKYLLETREAQRAARGLDSSGLVELLTDATSDRPSEGWLKNASRGQEAALVHRSGVDFDQCDRKIAQLLFDHDGVSVTSDTIPFILRTSLFSVAVIESMLQSGDLSVKASFTDKNASPLHIAVRPALWGNYEYLPNFDEHIHRSKQRTSNGGGCLDVAELLLRYGANPNAKTVNGVMPLHLCAKSLSLVKLLVDAGANVNACCRVGSVGTPLIRACQCGGAAIRDSIVEFLLEKGARADLTDFYGHTCLHHLCSMCYPDAAKTMKMLLDAGADPDAQTRVLASRKKPVWYLMQKRGVYSRFPFPQFIEITQVLIRGGMNPNLRDEDGDTVLMRFAKNVASYYKADEVQALVQLLLEEGGADPTIADNDGKLPAGLYPRAPRAVENTIQRFLKNKERAKLLEERAAAAEAKKANARNKKAHADNGATKAGKKKE